MLSQILDECQRSSEIYDIALDLPSLGKPGNRLVDDRYKDGGRDILRACTLVYQRLDVRFCKYSAS